MTATVLRASDPRSARELIALPEHLDLLRRLLRDVASSCDAASELVVPKGGPETSLSERYRATTAAWPVAPPPAYERLAAVLAGLNDAALTIRRVADELGRARDALRPAIREPAP
jgi:hypothetical protein